MVRQRTRMLVVLLGILAALGLVGLGRATAADPGARTRADHDGALAGYADGFRDGHAEGLQEGRALAKGGNGITYRLAARIPARDGVDYQRCPPPTFICQQPRG